MRNKHCIGYKTTTGQDKRLFQCGSQEAGLVKYDKYTCKNKQQAQNVSTNRRVIITGGKIATLRYKTYKTYLLLSTVNKSASLTSNAFCLHCVVSSTTLQHRYYSDISTRTDFLAADACPSLSSSATNDVKFRCQHVIAAENRCIDFRRNYYACRHCRSANIVLSGRRIILNVKPHSRMSAVQQPVISLLNYSTSYGHCALLRANYRLVYMSYCQQHCTNGLFYQTDEGITCAETQWLLQVLPISRTHCVSKNIPDIFSCNSRKHFS